MPLGEKIRQFRLLKGLTQENITDKLQISHTAYGEIDLDKSDIGYSRFEEIVRVLTVPIWILLGLDDRGYTYFNGNYQTYIVDSQIGSEQNLLFEKKDLLHEINIAKLNFEALNKELILKDKIIEYFKQNL